MIATDGHNLKNAHGSTWWAIRARVAGSDVEALTVRADGEPAFSRGEGGGSLFAPRSPWWPAGCVFPTCDGSGLELPTAGVYQGTLIWRDRKVSRMVCLQHRRRFESCRSHRFFQLPKQPGRMGAKSPPQRRNAGIERPVPDVAEQAHMVTLLDFAGGPGVAGPSAVLTFTLRR